MGQAEVRRRQAQAISMVLALVTLVIITRLTGFNGVAYVAAALEVYAVFSSAVSGSVANVLGRILRLRGTKGQYRNAAVMRRNAFIFQTAFGLLGTVVLLAGADAISTGLFRMRYGSAILMILAPAVCLRSLSSLLIGYSRGRGGASGGSGGYSPAAFDPGAQHPVQQAAGGLRGKGQQPPG